MRESRTSGSVEGVPSNGYPYSDYGPALLRADKAEASIYADRRSAMRR